MGVIRENIKGARNTRDIAQYVTADGRKIKSGILFRSGKLDDIPIKDLNEFINKHDVRTIIDLRTQTEVNNEKKVIYPQSIDYYHIPVLNDEFFGITHEKSMARIIIFERHKISQEVTGEDYMQKMYESIVFDINSQRRFKTFFDILLNYQGGGVIYHCNGGKDRTGIATMFLLTLFGVSKEDILTDYVASDEFNYKYNRRLSRLIKILLPNKRLKKLLIAMLYTKRIYLEKTIESIEKKYGSVLNYLRVAINIDEEKQKRLQDLFLE